jgi:hypothetical protein
MMVQDQPLGRDVPSRPGTVLGARQGATEQQQQQQRGAMPGSGRSLRNWICSAGACDDSICLILRAVTCEPPQTVFIRSTVLLGK